MMCVRVKGDVLDCKGWGDWGVQWDMGGVVGYPGYPGYPGALDGVFCLQWSSKHLEQSCGFHIVKSCDRNIKHVIISVL